MLLGLFEFLLWFQPAATGGGGGGGGGGGAPAGGAPGASGGLPPGCDGKSMFMLVAMIGIFYFMLIRPESKRRKERESMLGQLKVGDVIRTSGGIRGEITRINDSEATIEVSERVRINVLRSYIAGIDPSQDGAGADETGDSDSK